MGDLSNMIATQYDNFVKFRTFRKDCPAELCLRASEDGMSLVVKKFVAEHNHAISRVCSLIIHNA